MVTSSQHIRMLIFAKIRYIEIKKNSQETNDEGCPSKRKNYNTEVLWNDKINLLVEANSKRSTKRRNWQNLSKNGPDYGAKLRNYSWENSKSIRGMESTQFDEIGKICLKMVQTPVQN